MAFDHTPSAAQDQSEYAESEIRRQVGQRLTEQQRAWLLKMPAWTAVRGEDILRHLDALVTDNALLRAENERLRSALERIYQQGRGPHVEIARQALDG